MHGRARRGWAVLLAAIAVLVAACAPLPTRSLRATPGEILAATQNATPLPSTTGFAPANATLAQRTDTVERIWRTIADLYFDPSFNGVDLQALRARSLADLDDVRSDAAFYRMLKRHVRALHDSHTLVLTPREAEDQRVRRATQIGLVFAIAEQRVVVASVVPGFPGDLAGVRAGMILEAVDGQRLDASFFERPGVTPTEPFNTEPFELGQADADRTLRLRAVRALLVAPDGVPQRRALTLRRADDSLLQVEVEARGGDLPTRESLEIRPSGVAVLKLSRFDSSVRDDLARDLDRAATDSRALILDLRGNPGGEQRLYEWLVGRFVDRRMAILETMERRGATRTIDRVEASPAARPYTKPIAILIDRSTGSAAELTAHTLVEQRDALAVGEATCGCVVAIRGEYALPDGGALRVARVGFRTPQGRRMEADPLVPAIPVVPTLAERRAGRDVPVETAERALLALPALR